MQNTDTHTIRYVEENLDRQTDRQTDRRKSKAISHKEAPVVAIEWRCHCFEPSEMSSSTSKYASSGGARFLFKPASIAALKTRTTFVPSAALTK